MVAGRPLKFKTPEELQEEIDWYFFEAEYDCCGYPRDTRKYITITGLALHLGFADRQSVQDYRKRDKFSFTIKRACTIIENYLEECLFGNNVTGIIFNLKNNFGWKDKSEQEIYGKGGKDLKWEVEIVKPKDNNA